MFVSLLRISNPNRPRFGPDPPRVRTQRFGWLHYLRLATTELQPVTRLLDLAVASTKSSSLAPVVGAVVPLMASKKGGLGDEVGWLVGWLVKFQKLTPLMAQWVVSNILEFSNLFGLVWSYWFEVGWFAWVVVAHLVESPIKEGTGHRKPLLFLP